MDNSKINQTELSYKCGAGESKVNLYTGRMVFNAVDANVGTDSYELILYHIYNSHLGLPVGVSTKVGSKWKLNLQEYIYKVGTDYYYIDASGMKINFKYLYENTYYDTSGLGMQLRLLTDQIEIIDMANNKKIFRNNRLEEIISGEHSSIIKELVYTDNKLTLIKDTRKPDTNIKLDYINDLLSSIIVTVKNKEQLRLKYYYKENQLVMISKIVDGFEKVSTLFRYTGDNLTYAVCYQNKSALKFTYNSADKVIRVDTGVAKIKSTKISSNNVFLGESIYCGEKDYVGDTTYINNYEIEECITEYGRDLLTYNIITYNESNSVVKNEKGLKNVYYFNENGFMVSILESVNTSNTNLKTLKKMPGKSMLNENGGDDSEIINTQNAFNLTTISEISTSTIMSGRKKSLDDYRGRECGNYINYICSFWLKLLEEVDNSKVQLIINDDVDNKSIVSFDNSAVDAWQEVRIPIKILDDNIKNIKLEFLEKSEKNIKIVDMKLYYSSTYKTMLTNGTTWACLDEIQKIIYINQDGIEGEIILDDENFITEKDLQMTYMHKFKLYGNSNDLNNYYPLYLNDATKQLIVSSSKFYCKKNGVIKEFPIIFGNDDYSSKINVQNTRAQYFIESLSPDGNVYIYNIPHFLKSFKIDGVLYDCLCNITEGNKNIKGSDEHECSFKVECIDLTGKKVLTRDEYGVVNIYKYNNNGVLKNKILTSEKNTSNKIVYNMESELNTENDSNEYLVKIEDNSKTQINTKYDLRGNLLCTSMVGLENQESHEYVQKYSYSNLDNFLLSVKDNLGGINNIRYDEMGRIIEISPKKFNDPNYYGFKFKYDDFSEPTHLYYTFKQGNEVIDIILVEKIIDRTNNTVITKYYREDSSELNADIRKVVLDSYGDIQKIIIGDKKITYKNHQLWESPHSANVETIEDEFDNKTYSYKYDDYNNLTKYSIKDENGTINVYKSDNDTIECEENFTKSHFNPSAGIATIKYEEDILFAPRIKETTHQIYYGYQGNPTTYDYDDLGRLNKKYVSYIDGFIHFVNMTQNINFLEKTNCIKKISTSFTDENKKSTTFQSEYKYDQYGNLEEDHLSIDNNTDKFLRKYKYNEANQIIREEIVNSNITYEYYYNNDGSIDYIKTNGIQKNYNYQNGRVSLITEGGLVKIPITYDNIGNVKTFGANSYSWTRGNLLASFCNNNSVTKYHYNGFNKKYKKELSNGIIINYNYDNDKIISENWSNGNQLKFSYDATGITGFLYKENEGIMNNYYYFVKDAFGSVISLIYDGKEVAHYEYDSFGNCTVTNYTDENIGDINPIRWKGMYYEIESGVYLIGNDTYCPSLRQNISMKLLEDIVTSDYEIYNIYPYQLTNSNMLNMTFEQNNLLSSLELVYEPEKKSKWTRFWEKFWRSIFGKIISVCLAIIAFALTWWQGGWLGVLFLAIPLVITLGVGCLAAGIASKRTGKGFWNGFVNHLNRNWSQVIGTEMALYLISFGISKLMKLGTTADCFKAGTLVLTSIGLIKIEDIKEGDKVWSYNEDTKETELKTVKRIFINKTQEWLYITIVNSETMRENEIVCTKAHRIYIKNKGWIKASEILENDEVLLYNNIKGKVIKKELKKLSKEEYTYNFEVEDNHNYYVGNDRILVHNKCKPEFEVLEFDERAIAMAREGNPTFQTFKRRLFKYQNEIDPTLFSSYKKGLSPTINNKKIILHHPKGRVGPNLYNVVGVTYQQHLSIHAIIGYRNAQWGDVIYHLGKGVF